MEWIVEWRDHNLFIMPRVKSIGIKNGQASRATAFASKSTLARKSSIAGNRSFKTAVRAITDIQSEKKAYMLQLAAVAITGSTGSALNAMGQGDDFNTRDGRMIVMKGLTVNVGVAIPLGVTLAHACHGAWAIVLDREAKGAAPTWDSVYDESVVTDPAIAPRNTNTIDRYKVLMRRDFVVYPLASGQSQDLKWQEYVDFSKLADKDRRVRYSATTSGIAAVVTNSVYLLYTVSNQGGFTYTTGGPSITWGTKLSFIDA